MAIIKWAVWNWNLRLFLSNPTSYYHHLILSSQELQTNDALAVEATSYALLTLFLVEGGGVTIVQVWDCVNLFLFYQNPIFSG